MRGQRISQMQLRDNHCAVTFCCDRSPSGRKWVAWIREFTVSVSGNVKTRRMFDGNRRGSSVGRRQQRLSIVSPVRIRTALV